MKRTVWLWQLVGFAVTALGGTLLHFLYEWTDSALGDVLSGEFTLWVKYKHRICLDKCTVG